MKTRTHCFVLTGDTSAFGRLSNGIVMTQEKTQQRGMARDTGLLSNKQNKKKVLNSAADVAWDGAGERAACKTKWIPSQSQQRKLIEQQDWELWEDLPPLHVRSCLMSNGLD